MLDGEIVIAAEGTLSFDDLLMRIHPAASRIRKLSEATPATFIIFDLLVDATGTLLTDLPLEERRKELERLRYTLPEGECLDSAFAGDQRSGRRAYMVSYGSRAGWSDRQTPRPPLSKRQEDRHAKNQAAKNR